jgi:hypothetical protein
MATDRRLFGGVDTGTLECHLIERIIEPDADHAKGTPIFIEP